MHAAQTSCGFYVKADAMADIVIARRFCGPKNSGNGGYCAGLFAAALNEPAAVMLKAPPPLETPISLEETDDGAEARCGDAVIAVVKPADVKVDMPELPDNVGVAAAHDAFLSDAGGEHLIPHCFVCGTRRAPGDGLRIFSGPAPESVVNADFWIPGDDLSGDDGLVRPEFLWAALDCPTAFALRLWPRLLLLGRQAVAIYRRPAPGEKLVAAAWPVRSEGRKHFADAVLMDADRNVIAAANALWIEIKDEAMLAQMKADRESA